MEEIERVDFTQPEEQTQPKKYLEKIRFTKK